MQSNNTRRINQKIQSVVRQQDPVRSQPLFWIDQLFYIILMKNQQSQTSEDTSKTYPHHSTLFPHTHIKSYKLYVKLRGKNAQNQSYDKQLQPFATISTLQDFFKYYSSLKLPSQFQVNVKIMLFEQKCIPRWQDWVDSGCLILQFKQSKQFVQCQILDQIWQYLLFSMVGNQLDKDIIGICLSKHQKQNLIQLWLRNSHRKLQIGKLLEELIQNDLQFIVKMKKPIKVTYKDHRISIEKNSTMKGSQKLAFIQPNRIS